MGTQISGGRITQIANVLATVLAADLGTTDLSATGRLMFGRFIEPPTFPFLALDLEGITTDPDAPLGQFIRLARFQVQGWYTITTSTPTAAFLFENLMASEVFAAVEDAHRDAGGALTVYDIRRVWFDDYEQHNTTHEGRIEARWTAKLYIQYMVNRGL